jgi:hypothetical protein
MHIALTLITFSDLAACVAVRRLLHFHLSSKGSRQVLAQRQVPSCTSLATTDCCLLML